MHTLGKSYKGAAGDALGIMPFVPSEGWLRIAGDRPPPTVRLPDSTPVGPSWRESGFLRFFNEWGLRLDRELCLNACKNLFELGPPSHLDDAHLWTTYMCSALRQKLPGSGYGEMEGYRYRLNFCVSEVPACLIPDRETYVEPTENENRFIREFVDIVQRGRVPSIARGYYYECSGYRRHGYIKFWTPYAPRRSYVMEIHAPPFSEHRFLDEGYNNSEHHIHFKIFG